MTVEEYVQDAFALLERGVEALEVIARALVALEPRAARPPEPVASSVRGGRKGEA